MNTYKINLNQYGTFQLQIAQNLYALNDFKAPVKWMQNRNSVCLLDATIRKLLSENKPHCLAIIEVVRGPKEKGQKFYPVDAMQYFGEYRVNQRVGTKKVPNPSSDSIVKRVHLAIIKSQSEGFQLFTTFTSNNNGEIHLESCPYSCGMLLAMDYLNLENRTQELLEQSRMELMEIMNDYFYSEYAVDIGKLSETDYRKYEKNIKAEYLEVVYWMKLSCRDFPMNGYFHRALLGIYLIPFVDRFNPLTEYLDKNAIEALLDKCTQLTDLQQDAVFQKAKSNYLYLKGK